MVNRPSALTEEKETLLKKTTKTAILRSVAGVITDDGLTLSMGELAEKAGVGRATLYRYFPNRKQLLESIRDLALEEISEVITQTLTSNLKTEDALARISRAILNRAELGVLFIREKIVIDKPLLERLLLSPVDQIFIEAQGDGAITSSLKPRIITTYFLGLLRTGSLLVVQNDSSPEEAAADIINLIFHGFRAPES